MGRFTDVEAKLREMSESSGGGRPIKRSIMLPLDVFESVLLQCKETGCSPSHQMVADLRAYFGAIQLDLDSSTRGELERLAGIWSVPIEQAAVRLVGSAVTSELAAVQKAQRRANS